MSILTLNLNEFKQNFDVTKEDKLKYGEIYTPFSLIKNMMSLIPEFYFKDPNLKWLDAGAGSGYFSIYLFNKLDIGLKTIITDQEKRHQHILQNMLYMVEIKKTNIIKLKNLFGNKSNIFNEDFLFYKSSIKFDFIIGNPPYNADGIKKVPTNNNKSKKEDGKTIWISFIKQSISLLKSKGKLLFIIPSIWMKPDKARTYYYLLQYKIHKLHCLTNTETNKYFKGEAQTPTCYFLLSKEPSDNFIDLFDKCREKYVKYSFNLEEPIPLFGQSIINKLKPFLKVGYLKVKKTNLPNKNVHIIINKDATHQYPNIKTCHLQDTKPSLIINYSNNPLSYNGDKKIILAHKMYGFPYLDLNGDYGISNRDNYVINDYTLEELKIIQNFLSTKTALYIYEATRYRMKYLEKYAFQLIPDITKLIDFPSIINDETIATYFNFDNIDKENIQKLHKKNYNFSFSS